MRKQIEIGTYVDQINKEGTVIKSLNQHKIMFQTKNTGKFSLQPLLRETFNQNKSKLDRTSKVLVDAEK